MQRERAELEQNFAREIGNLVQRLSAEKDQLEAELKLKADQEVMLVRWVMTSQLAPFRCVRCQVSVSAAQWLSAVSVRVFSHDSL